MAQLCQALNLSDEKKCQEEATHADGLFCRHHARHCMGMYLGYKKRNEKLDALNAAPPSDLADSKTPLRNETYAGVKRRPSLKLFTVTPALIESAMSDLASNQSTMILTRETFVWSLVVWMVVQRASRKISPRTSFTTSETLPKMLLFPDERQDNVTAAIKGFDDPISLFMEIEPDMKKFVYDLDTDEDEDDYEDLRPIGSKKGTNGPKSLLSREQLEELDEPRIPDHIPECPNPEDPNCHCEECKWCGENVPEEEEGLKPSGRGSHQAHEADLGSNGMPEGPEMLDQYVIFLQREGSKAFRQQWHEADLVPGSKERWRAMTGLFADIKEVLRPKDNIINPSMIIEVLKMELWLEYPQTHRLFRLNMFEALNMASLAFDWSPQGQLIREGLSLKQYILLENLMDNEEKARGQPYSRSFQSAETRPNEFWQRARQQIRDNDRDMPEAWDLTARAITAAWFRAGMLCPAYDAEGSGQISLITEDGAQTPDLFIDYHDLEMEHPPEPSSRKINLLQHASAFVVTHKTSRFALLRLWSHSHFWPLLLAGPNREAMPFIDTYGRRWYARFIPKDMPYSDISMHNMVQERVKRFDKQFHGKVIFKRDMALVMGEDEVDLRWNMAGAIFALMGRPWRFEVDLWRSFVNVDFEFLKGLREGWLE